jgi:type I restriction enzyme S subunit
VTNPQARWKELLLRDCVAFLDNKRIPVNSKERSKRVGTVPYYGATGQVEFINDHLFDEELLLIGEDGAPFLDKTKPIAYLIRGKSWVNNHAHVLKADTNITSNAFLKYYLDSFDFHGFVSGTTRLKLPLGQLRQIPLCLPPLAEQRRIVAEIEKQFTRLDDGILQLRRAHARSRRCPSVIVRKAFDGNLPMRPLKDLASIKGGLTMHADRQDIALCKPVPYLRVANVQRGALDLPSSKQ